jgi:6,7-dimethyl-8-ribityllumazine synthase
MSDFQLPPKPRVMGKKNRVAVVASRFNSAFTDALVEHTLSEFIHLHPDAFVDLHYVPGAFEIPYAVEHLARYSPPDAIIALGVIIRGETPHGDIVANSVTQMLHQISVKHLVPIINEVLLVNDKSQAKERTMGDRLNRGREAARAAATMFSTVEKLRKSRQTRNNKANTDGQETRRA